MSMYIMYACLFSTLSRRVGALQIAIIIIIIIYHVSAQGTDERMINVHYYYYN